MAMTIKVSKLKPLAGYVLVEPAKADKKTASGINLVLWKLQVRTYKNIFCKEGSSKDNCYQDFCLKKSGHYINIK